MRALWVVVGIIVGIVALNLTVYAWTSSLIGFGFVDRGPDGVDWEYLLQFGSLSAQVGITSGWLIGAGVGAFAAFVIARSDWTGWFVAVWTALMAISILLMTPFMPGLKLLAVTLPFVGAVFAFGLYRRWRAARLHLRP